VATSLEESKNNFRLIVYDNNSIKPGNLAKIGPVDAETIGLREIVKIVSVQSFTEFVTKFKRKVRPSAVGGVAQW